MGALGFLLFLFAVGWTIEKLSKTLDAVEIQHRLKKIDDRARERATRQNYDDPGI